MQTSAKGRAFIALHEGNPLTAYLDPVGVPTIGPGLTNRSAVVTRMIGKLVPGKTKITTEQADRVFAAVLAEEVEPVVNRRMPGAAQHEFDAAASGSFNLGADRFMSWTWADLWRAGKKKEAAAHLANNYNTAGGKKLPGLVRRRKEEAKLLLEGVYTGVDLGTAKPDGVPRQPEAAPAGVDPVVKEAQELLKEQGIDPGKVDGKMGPRTSEAIKRYQRMHPHLTVDGILGPATLAQLRRDAQAVGNIVKDVATKALPGAGAAGGAAFLADLPWGWIAAGVLLLVVAWSIWKYRDIVQRRIAAASGGANA